MAVVELEYERSDGATRRIPVDAAELTRRYGEEDRAKVDISWRVWNALEGHVDRANDAWRLYWQNRVIHGGRLADDARQGVVAELMIGSWEEDARDAKPTPPGHRFENVSDTTIFQDAVDRVPTLSAGTVEEVVASTSMVFPRSSPAGMIRSLARSTGAEVKYRADQTVDYVRRLGQDTGQELSPDADAVGQLTPQVDRRDGVTHILVRGAGEGDAQIEATAIAASFSAGDREVWRSHRDKELTKQEQADRVAEKLMAEIDNAPRHLVVEAQDVDVFPPPEIGDGYRVSDRRRGLDEEVLRVTELRWTFDRDGAQFARLVLGNRPFHDARQRNAERRQISRFAGGYEGVSVPINDTISRQPVSGSINAVGHVFVPDDVVQELDARLLVEGLAYRAYSSGAASSGGTTTSETTSGGGGSLDPNGTDESSTVTLASGDDHTFTFTIPSGDGNGLYAYIDVGVFVGWGANEELSVDVTIRESGGSVKRRPWSRRGKVTDLSRFKNSINLASGDARDDLEVRITNHAGGSRDFKIFIDWFAVQDHAHGVGVDHPSHTHPPDPGITEFSRFPENVDVLVDGASAGVSLGDGTGAFQQEVDIGGMLTSGFNKIELTSDSLGHIRANLFADVFRQVFGGS